MVEIIGGSEEIAYPEEISALDIESKKAQNDLLDIHKEDIQSKLNSRRFFILIFTAFLGLQNWYVYTTVNKVLFYDIEGLAIQDLEMILPILIGGTIAQTVSIVAIMVKWVFSDIDYKNSPNNGNGSKWG